MASASPIVSALGYSKAADYTEDNPDYKSNRSVPAHHTNRVAMVPSPKSYFRISCPDGGGPRTKKIPGGKASPASRKCLDTGKRFCVWECKDLYASQTRSAANGLLYPIGTIHTPWTDIAGMPIQPGGAQGVKGTVEIRPEFAEGLRDLEGFSRIILIYAFHRCSSYNLVTKPFLDTVPREILLPEPEAAERDRVLLRPGLPGKDTNILNIEDVDMLDGTPLLDIKPYRAGFRRIPGLCLRVAGKGRRQCPVGPVGRAVPVTLAVPV